MTERQMILDAYAQALLAARTKGMFGADALLAARKATAKVVSKATGRTITADQVLAVVETAT